MNRIISIILVLPLYGQVLDDRYHTLEEIYSLMDSINQIEAIEDWVHLDTIGFSTQENIPILGMRISDNAAIKEDEPRVLFIGQVHAEEILGIEIVLDLMKDLLFPDASIHTHMNILKQYLDIWLIPTANPEGLNVVHDGLDLSYRKNKRDLSPSGPIPNGLFDYDPSIGNDIDGVDLNRNFQFNWAFGDTFLEPDNSDYASHYDYYKGEEPFSESEAIAIRDLALGNDFVFSIVWHSSRSGNLSEKVFTSWKWEEVKESPDLGIMKSIGDHIAESIETEDGTSSYLSVYSGSRNGKLHDWFYRETGSIQYLIEAGTSNLQPDSALVENTIARTKPAMVYLMDRAIGYYADASQITGIVYDAHTGTPIQGVNVEVAEHKGGVIKPRLTNEFGRYRRVLDVGTYSFSFKAHGYLSQEISLVANNSSITDQDIYLQPAPIHQLNIKLIHDHTDIITISGRISNEYYSDAITISSGDNFFQLPEEEYEIEFPMYNEYVPWQKTINLNNNFEIITPYENGLISDLSYSFPWQESIGTWTMCDTVLKTQEGTLYENMDSISGEMSMMSDAIDVSGSNRVVVKIDHRYETEWDHDMISVKLLDASDSLLASKLWSGDQWNHFKSNLLTATSDSLFDSVRVLLSFSPDGTVNYRGWEIRSINLFAISDENLSIKEINQNRIPDITMEISGIYPNPSNGRFQIELDQYPGGKAVLDIYNLLGQQLYSRKINDIKLGRNYINIDLAHLNGIISSSGVLFVRIATQKQQVVKKCILLKN